MNIKRKSRWGMRFLISVAGLIICALGVVLSTKAALGTAPFTSFSFVISLIGTRTLGFYMTTFYLLYLSLQLVLLRREFQPIAILQLPASTIMGWFVDLWNYLFRNMDVVSYPGKMALLLLGVVVMSLGVAVYVEPDMMPLPVDGLIVVIARKLKMPFGRVKLIHDVTVVSLTAILSLTLLGGIQGIREGTVISALLLGRVITAIKTRISPPIQRLCYYQETVTEEN